MYAQIAISTPVDHLFTYEIPPELSDKIEIGARVIVPLNRRDAVGYIIELINNLPKNLKDTKIKAIKRLLDEKPAFSKNMLRLIKWMNNYYQRPIGDICKTALPNKLTSIKFTDVKSRKVIIPDESLDDSKGKPLKLTPNQQIVFDSIEKSLVSGKASNYLLHGITGSGKTEIYIKLFERLLELGSQGILLVPEISLTPQLIGRFKKAFGDKVGLYHSGLTDSQRLDQWNKAQNNEISIMVGTRSAIFAPFSKLKLIIIDEEHDSSYKQEDMLTYNARDVAIVRGKFEEALCVMGTATPSLESYYNAKTSLYHYLHLPDRPFGAVLPKVKIVDMCDSYERNENSKFLSYSLISAINDNLKNNKQTLLFFNRRGYANFLLCEDCGHTYVCPNCNITMTYHLKPKKLVCHYCELSVTPPNTCEKCNGINIKYLGSGTEKIESEIEKLFPNAKIGRLDSDTSGKKDHRRNLLNKMHNNEIDILIGTQIITKGHDFSNVTLVGIIDADIALNIPDFRAAEKTFQTITQVAGRSGRTSTDGQVLIQTYNPEHPSIMAAQKHDFKAFYDRELTSRKEVGYPPFARLANIKLLSSKEDRVIDSSKKIAKMLKRFKNGKISILGPAPAVLDKIRGKWRWQILIKGSSAKELNNFLHSVRPYIDELTPSGVKINIDVDPINLL